jgi:hypothetical protein
VQNLLDQWIWVLSVGASPNNAAYLVIPKPNRPLLADGGEGSAFRFLSSSSGIRAFLAPEAFDRYTKRHCHSERRQLAVGKSGGVRNLFVMTNRRGIPRAKAVLGMTTGLE